MTPARSEFPGCLYGDAMPEGEQAIFQPGDGSRQPKFLTHAGDLTPPRDGTDWPLYHFITNVGGFQIIGQSQHFTKDITWHWAGIQRGWTQLPPTNGVNGVIFDGHGQIRRIEPQAGATSQGYRFVAPNGEPVLGDLTRITKFDIIEWIDLSDDQDGGLLFGQYTNGRDDCVVRIGGVLRLVQPGRCTFIRARRTGDRVAMAMFTTRLSDERPVPGVLIVRGTLDQFAELPEVTPREIPVETLDKEMWVGAYEFMLSETRPLGNCIVACDPIGDVIPSGECTLPTIVATSRHVSGPVIGQYIIGNSVDEIEAHARLSPHRVIAYWDQTREWPRLPQLPPNALTCVMGYCLKDETPDALERALRGVINRMPSHRIALVCQGYTGNPKWTSDIESLIPVYVRLAKLPQVEMLLIFSDAGRNSGLMDNFTVRLHWLQATESVRTPRTLPMPTLKPPIFRISEPTFPLTVELREGEIWRRRFVAEYDPAGGKADWIQWQFSTESKDGPWAGITNPADDLDHTFEVRKPGSYWFRARAWNSAGTHQTGLERKLTVTRTVEQPQTPVPDPPPPQPVLEGTSVKTVGGFFWSIGPGGLIEAKAPSADAESTIRVLFERHGDKRAILVIHPSIGRKYINFAPQGDGSLVANRDQAFEDELFFVDVVDADLRIISIETKTRKYAHAENGGGGRVLANKDTMGPHETFQVAMRTSGGAGQALLPLRKENGRFRTDAGWIVPRCYSVFHAPGLARDGSLDELRRQFDRAQQARCNMVRVFGGWQFINGPLAPYSQDDPNWFGWMDTVLGEAASRSLYVVLSYFCDAQVLVPSAHRRIELFEELAHWSQAKPSVIVTAANEARKNGWAEADDPALLDLVRRFKAINQTTLLGASDPLDGEGPQASIYNARQRKIGESGVDFLLVHPTRSDRYEWVNHLYHASLTPPDVGFDGICWIEEPMGGASQDVGGKRDRSPIAHIAAACVGAMCGAYTYMHRQMEDDVAPGLIESGIAAEIPGSPDYFLINATLPGSPVGSFRDFDKCRTVSNGTKGWVVAYGTEGTITYNPGWREVNRWRWQENADVCLLTQVER